jgi:hypothetical protein
MTRGRLAVAFAAAALVVSACSSSASTPAPQPGSTGANPTPAANPTATEADVMPSFVMPAGGNGSCKVDITGAISTSWESKQDLGTLLVSQWLSASQLSVLGMGPSDEAFILNCKTDAGAIDFTSTAGTTADLIPVAPGEYTIAASGSTGDTPGQLSVLVSLHDGNIWRVAKAGSFKITTFGGSKFAGSFQFDVTSTAGDATVSGTFDLTCTGDACS